LIHLNFAQQMQQALEFLQFGDGHTFHELGWGTGRVFFASYPVELSENSAATASLYHDLLESLSIQPPFTPSQPIQQGVLAYSIELETSVLYVFESEFGPENGLIAIQLNDGITGAPLEIRLPAQHAALAVIDKKTKQIVAKYGF
jgi:hypothetical protein